MKQEETQVSKALDLAKTFRVKTRSIPYDFLYKIKLLNKLTKGYQRGYYWHVDVMDDLVDLLISLWQVEGAKPKRSASQCSA